jgi:uncharacterized membrane protein
MVAFASAALSCPHAFFRLTGIDKRFQKTRRSIMETSTTFSAQGQAATSLVPPATGSSNINLEPSERIVSAFGGAALTVLGLKNLGSTSGITMLLSGGYLLLRGLSGYCAVQNLIDKEKTTTHRASAMEVSTSFNINKPRSDVYAFWRKLENLPKFMQHLEEVKELDDKRSKWTAKLPGGLGKVSWEAEIQEDISGEVISWCSLPGSRVDNAGEVRFSDAPDGKGTEVAINISYRLPAGDLGSVAAKLFNPAVEKMMREDVRTFKQILETGEQENDRFNTEKREELYV